MSNSEIEYAGFWVRAGATLIDSLLIVVLTAPILVFIYGWDYFSPDNTSLIAGPADFLIMWVLPVIAAILFWIHKQATPGKMAFSLRVLDAKTGNSLTARQSIIRYVAYFISLVPFGLGVIWVGLDKRKQGWHDKVAGTVVVRVKDSDSSKAAWLKVDPAQAEKT